MVKKHLKRLAAPKSWPIKRKQGKFTVKPLPSGHPLKFSLPVRIIIRDVLGYADNASEVNTILLNKNVLIDGKQVKDNKRAAGLMDVVSFPQINEHFKVKLNSKGKLFLEKTSAADSKTKLCKIIGKNMVKGKRIQLALHDGRSLIAEKDNYKVGESLLLAVPKQEITGHLKLEKKAKVYFTGGKRVGLVGEVEKIGQDELVVRFENSVFEVKKEFAFVVKK